MNADQLRELQRPLKEQYRERPDTARKTLRARGTIEPGPAACHVETALGKAPAGLHPAAGGDGSWVCSGDMLLEALAGCAGVTLAAVASAMGIPLRGGSVTVEGEMDFRGTLGVSKDVPVGFDQLRLRFELDSDASPEQLQKLAELTERYCVVFQTLKHPPRIEVGVHAAGA
ncbi:MAG TPA: OsmC family protein [Planctomycetaceae bacterium]|nr:OsmC family protein [Planctomycetaceae bacterium]